MFRLTTLRRTASILTIATLAATSVAHAQVSNDSVTLERVLNEETGNSEMARTRTGDIGTVTTERVCGEGQNVNDVQGCVQVKTVIGADGRTYSQEQVVIQGPERTRAFGRTSNDNGNNRRFLQRWRN